MLSFLSQRLKKALSFVDGEKLYELRIRADGPLRANIGGSFVYLGESGVVDRAEGALRPTREEVEESLFAASGYCVYSVENQIRQGFVTSAEGERIGIAGSHVCDEKGVLSVYAVTSLCVRIPHCVQGCAEEIYARCFRSGVCSLLLLSPPGQGKTTILRDLSRLVCERTQRNVLVCDERGELSAGSLGDTSDVVRFSDKLTAFTDGIRAMRPDVIVTDELLGEDYTAVRRAVESGIVVFASAHLVDYNAVPQKLFSRYVFLEGTGNVKKILDGRGEYVD